MKPREPWLAALLLGAALGALLLGVGGRLAMRGVTLWEDRARLFSVAGTLTVVAWGAGLGAAGGLLRAILEGIVPRFTARAPRRTALALWWALSVGVALVLLTPWTRSRLAIFPIVVLAFLAAFEVAWRRRRWARASDAAPADAAA